MENDLFQNGCLKKVFKNYKFKINPVKKNQLSFLLGLSLVIVGLIVYGFMKNVAEYQIKYNEM